MAPVPHNGFGDYIKAINPQKGGRASRSFLLARETSDLGPESLLLIFLLRDAVKASMSKIRGQKEGRQEQTMQLSLIITELKSLWGSCLGSQLRRKFTDGFR